MKIAIISLLGALLGGCAIDPKALSGANLGANSVLGFYSTSADLRQQLALDTIKESAQLEYLSNYTRTCRDNPGYMFPTDFRTARNIKANTIARFEKSDRDYRFLLEYSKAFDLIVKGYGDVQTNINNAAIIARELGKYNRETAALAAVASLLGAAAVAVTEEVKFSKLRSAARIYQPQLEEHAKSLAGRLKGLDKGTLRAIFVWRDCVQEKFKVIALRTKPTARESFLPTSAIELDSAYGVFQAQYRSYSIASPQVGEMLEDIVKANNAIAKAPDSTRVRESIERYIVIFDNSKAAISAAGALSE